MDRMWHAQMQTAAIPVALPEADEKNLKAVDRWSPDERLGRIVHRLVRIA